MEFTTREPSFRLPAINHPPAPPKASTSSEVEFEESTPLILGGERRSSNSVCPEPESPRLQAWGTEIKTEKARPLEAISEADAVEHPQLVPAPIKWSAGWFCFCAGFLLYFPFVIGTLLPVVSKKHRTYTNRVAGMMSLVTLFYVTAVAAAVVAYRLTCDPSTCGMQPMSWINDLVSRN
ncbi:hypothetical protein BSKO_07533 [Bryopsis sp. KO-2023]|nr:hypothetical protein BSKO_07533 [Bryopsis sp. KO-2023]